MRKSTSTDFTLVCQYHARAQYGTLQIEARGRHVRSSISTEHRRPRYARSVRRIAKQYRADQSIRLLSTAHDRAPDQHTLDQYRASDETRPSVRSLSTGLTWPDLKSSPPMKTWHHMQRQYNRKPSMIRDGSTTERA